MAFSNFNRYLRYLWYRIKFPKRHDFLDVGFGIEARFERCRRFWEPHLRCSNEFQRRNFKKETNSALFVLGAGRLFDFDAVHALQKFKRLHLVDADPACEKAWNSRFNGDMQRVYPHILDLSSVIDDWTEKVRELCVRSNSQDELVELLKSLDPADCDIFKFRKFEEEFSILSLNLLSQIPIYFRDRVAAILLKHWRCDSDEDGRYLKPLQSAINESMGKLEQQHLKLLSESGAKKVLLISDAYFYYYQTDKTDWRSECALNGIEYDKMGPKIALPGYIEVQRDSWFWHIAPQFIESKDYGVIHQVIALSMELE